MKTILDISGVLEMDPAMLAGSECGLDIVVATRALIRVEEILQFLVYLGRVWMHAPIPLIPMTFETGHLPMNGDMISGRINEPCGLSRGSVVAQPGQDH